MISLNQYIFIFRSICCLLIFSGCDPARVLIIEPPTKNPLAITIYSSPLIYPYGNIDEGQQVVLRVSGFPDDSIHSRLFFYGLGRWEAESLTTISHYTDSIVIENDHVRKTYSGDSVLFNYYAQHRKGILHQRIELKKD